MPRRKTKLYPGYITKRSGAWSIRLCVGGVYHSFTVHGTRVDAQNEAVRQHAELAKDHGRAKAGLPGAVRFSTLVSDFETYELPQLAPGSQRSYGDSLKPFRSFFVEKLGDPIVRQISRSHIKTYLEWRRTYRVGDEKGDRSVSAHTVSRDRRVLHRLFSYALEKEYLDANPGAGVKSSKPDSRMPPILTADELTALLAAAEHNPMLHLYILLLADTGVRADSEALQLRWEDIDPVTDGCGYLEVKSGPGRRTKSGKSRWVPLTPRLKAALQEHAARFRMAMYEGVRSPFLFHHTLTTRSAVAGQQVRSIADAFEGAAKRAKMPEGFRRHDLRHRRASRWVVEGENVVDIQGWMGHANIATTMVYVHRAPKRPRSAVEAEKVAPTTRATAQA
ncbi:MAG TPA: site-specific integrase [Gemmatimonadaceae bacterium]|nr:site-specific integrase [Gemmatimonadaceae bacterium]